MTGFTFLSRLTQIAPPHTRFVFLGAGFRLGLPSHPASRRRSCLRLGVSTTSSSRGLSPPSDRPCRAYSRRRLRRRWPGTSAGLRLGEARPAQPGHTFRGPPDQTPQRHAGPGAGRSRLPRHSIVPLPATASRPPYGRRLRWLRQPRPGVHSQGGSRLRGGREQSRSQASQRAGDRPVRYRRRRLL